MTQVQDIVTTGIVVMTQDEAKESMARIKASGQELCNLLIEFEEREGYKALGYDTWIECVQSELGFSKPYAYNLRTWVKVSKSLDLPPGQSISNRQARVLARVKDTEQRKRVYQDVVKKTDGKPTAQAVVEAIHPEAASQAVSEPSDAEKMLEAMRTLDTLTKSLSAADFVQALKARKQSPKAGAQRLLAYFQEVVRVC